MQGNSSDAKSARVKYQLRDRKGRWIEMGGLVKYTDGSDVMTGIVTDVPEEYAQDKLVSVKINTPNHKYFGEEILLQSKYIEAISEKATLDSISEDLPDTSENEDSSDNNNNKNNDDSDIFSPHDYDSDYDEDGYNEQDWSKDTPIKSNQPDENGFTSKYTVKDSAYKNFPGYTGEDEYALQHYVYEYESINTPMRKGYSNGGIIAKKLDEILDKSPLAEPVSVYRGMWASPDLFKKMKKDSIYFDKAFTSTSSNTKVPGSILSQRSISGNKDVPIIFEMNLPKGFKAHKFDYTINNSNRIERFESEEEVLLPANTAFRITSMELVSKDLGYKVSVEPILTKFNSVGVETNDDEAIKMSEEAQKKPKKWGLFNLNAEELEIGSKLINSNDSIIIEKVSDEIWEYKTASNKISYNNV